MLGGVNGQLNLTLRIPPIKSSIGGVKITKTQIAIFDYKQQSNPQKM
jgi:hypothetical protein